MKVNLDFTMAIGAINFLKDKNTKVYIRAEDIAKKLDLSLGYLQKVIQTLGKHGLVECKRGRIGGVRLRNRTITLLDVWNVSCGKLEDVDPPVPLIKKPLKAFGDAMKKVVICKKK